MGWETTVMEQVVGRGSEGVMGARESVCVCDGMKLPAELSDRVYS